MESTSKKALSVLSVFLVFCILAGLLSSGLFAAQATEADPSPLSEEAGVDPLELGYEPGSVIVAFRSDVGEMEAEALLEEHDSTLDTLVETAAEETVSVAELPAGQTVAEAISELSAEPNVEYVQPVYLYEPASDESEVEPSATTVNDPYANKQWHLDTIKASGAWDILQDTAAQQPVTVAVLDTPIDVNHEDLSGVINKSLSADFKTGSYEAPSMAPGSHGTHVAGIIGAISNNGTGVAGVASGADNGYISILPVNVFKYNSTTQKYSGTNAAIAGAIGYAVEQGAKVINLSLGGSPSDTDLVTKNAIDAAVDAGVTVIAAAGNNSSSETFYPADFENAISVINIAKFSDPDKNPRSSSSNYGDNKDISAPGDTILSTYPTGEKSYGYTSGYGTKSGTSMAAPIVTAVAAMLQYYSPSLTPAEIREILHTTATDLYMDGYDAQTGWGCVNAAAALSELATVTELTLTDNAKTLTQGEKFTLQHSVVPDNRKVKWATSDAAIAKVSGGKVTAVAPGKTTITATAGDLSATCEVTVYPAIPGVLYTTLGGDSTNILCWQRTAEVAGYEIERRLAGTGTWENSVFVPDSGFSSKEAFYTDDTANNKTTGYEYRIRACAGTPEQNIYPYYSEWSPALTPVQAASLSTPTLKSDGLRAITVDWNVTPGAVSYSVYRSESASGGFALLGSFSGSSCTDSKDLLPGKTYYYQVVPDFSSDGYAPADSTASGVASVMTSSVSAPATPTELSIKSANETAISLAWKAVADADGYTVERTLAGSEDKTTFRVDGSKTGFTDSKVTPNASYHYTVSATKQAYSQTLASKASAVVTEAALNPAIKDFKVKTYSYNTITVKWSAVPTAQEYNVYRSTKKSSGYSLQTILNSDTTTFKDTNLKINTKYYYKVQAVHYADGKKVTRNSSVIAQIARLKPPATVSAKSTSATAIKVKWSKVSGASGYIISYSTKKSGKFKTLKTVKSGASRSYTHKNLKPNKKYYYKITPYRTVSKKKYKGTPYKSAAVKPLASPKSLKAATPNCSTIKLTWKKPTAAKGYYVYMSKTGKSGSYKLVKKIKNPKKLSYTVKNLQPGTKRYFKIQTYGTANKKTVKGGTVTKTVTTPALAKPSGLTHTAVAQNTVRLSWKKVTGASGYYVYRSDDGKSGSYKLVKTLTSGSTLTFDQGGLALNKDYHYKVQSYCVINGKTVKGGTAVSSTIRLVATP